MASNSNFNCPRSMGEFPLARQSSVYSLTLEEFQHTLGGRGKDFGSMNMDELLKNIWTAEETQALTCVGEINNGGLQRQGSLTLPRTLSQKTVDEVWKGLLKDNTDTTDGGGGEANLPQRQQTLGEITLEEFLLRVGVVREDNQPANIGFYSCSNSNNTSATVLPQASRSDIFMGSSNRMVTNSPPDFDMKPQQSQQEPLFPKQGGYAFRSGPTIMNNMELSSRGLNKNLVAYGEGFGMGTGMSAAAVSPVASSAETSLSPVPYAFGRGRRSGAALEKAIERRQRRMIKNRESAARSRARKQAYTMELEAEIANLKEMNQQLKKKQALIMDMQKQELMESMNRSRGGKRRCLRRTLTGPW